MPKRSSALYPLTTSTRLPVAPKGSCGFCGTGHHKLCPRTIKNANPGRTDGLWICKCWKCDPEPHLEPGALVPESLWSPRPRS
jgi:hypothetical protein